MKIIFLLIYFIWSSCCYSQSEDCKIGCENHYEACTILLNNSKSSSANRLSSKEISEYLKKINILNINESIRVTEDNIYIQSPMSISNDPKIQKSEIQLLTRCLGILKECRQKCQK